MFLFMWQGMFRVSDVGMNTLLTFMASFLRVLIAAFGLPFQRFVQQLPQTYTAARSYLKGNVDNFIKYVSCPKCNRIFHLESCKLVQNRTVVSSTCPNVMFPNHPQKNTQATMWNSAVENGENINWFSHSLPTSNILLQKRDRIIEGNASTPRFHIKV